MVPNVAAERQRSFIANSPGQSQFIPPWPPWCEQWGFAKKRWYLMSLGSKVMGRICLLFLGEEHEGEIHHTPFNVLSLGNGG